MRSLGMLHRVAPRFLLLWPWFLLVAAAQSPDAPLVMSLAPQSPHGPQDHGKSVRREQKDLSMPPGKPFIDVTMDSFAPTGGSRGPLAAQAVVGAAFGLRPWKYVQVDAFGINVISPGMAGDGRQAYVESKEGSTVTRETRQIDDNSLLVTTGARFTLPIWQGRLLLSAGGGWAGLFVSEQIESPGDYYTGEPVIRCSSCRSRHGWGPTSVAEIMFYPSPAHPLGFGFHVRAVQIYSDGISLRQSPSPGANDRFLMIGGTVSFRFGN